MIKIVKQAFEIISLVTNKNPLKIVLRIDQCCSPREDSAIIGSGDTAKDSAVLTWEILFDHSRRENASFRTWKKTAECLDDELSICTAKIIVLMPLERKMKLK